MSVYICVFARVALIPILYILLYIMCIISVLQIIYLLHYARLHIHNYIRFYKDAYF